MNKVRGSGLMLMDPRCGSFSLSHRVLLTVVIVEVTVHLHVVEYNHFMSLLRMLPIITDIIIVGNDTGLKTIINVVQKKLLNFHLDYTHIIVRVNR